MTANIQFDSQTSLAQRRGEYEREVIDALLDETPEEREERLELVRVAQEMVLRAFLSVCESCDR
jgi:hypothetical protein